MVGVMSPAATVKVLGLPCATICDFPAVSSNTISRLRRDLRDLYSMPKKPSCPPSSNACALMNVCALETHELGIEGNVSGEKGEALWLELCALMLGV